MSDFKKIVEFFRLNRRFEEAEKKSTANNKISLTVLETNENYEINTLEYSGLKLLRDILNHFAPTEIFIVNSTSGKEFYVKTNTNEFFNLFTEQVNTIITPADLYTVSLEDFPFEIYFYDSIKNCVVMDENLIKNIFLFKDSIRYDPHSDFFEDFSHQETLSYSYKTHQTWIHDIFSALLPNNDAEGDPFAKYVSDSDVNVTQIRITQVIDIIPIIKESMGKYYAYYNLYKQDDSKIIQFYNNRNHFSTESSPVITLMFNSLGAFMSYFNDTIFSQTENFTIGKRETFLNQYYEIVVLPLIRNLESKSTFSYYDALQALYYLPESLFYMLPEGFLWTFFEKAIANDSFTNKPYSKEEDIFLKILQVLASTENNAAKLIERLIKKVGTENSQMLLEFFYERIHGNNFIEFAKIVNNAWRKTRFVNADEKQNIEFKNTDGPIILPYESEKWIGLYFSNAKVNFKTNSQKERFLEIEYETGEEVKINRTTPKGDSEEAFVNEIDYFWYHPFYPIYLKNLENQETELKLDSIVPAFMLKANQDKQFWNNVITSTEYALDVVTTLSGIGNFAKFRYLTKFATKTGNLRFVSKAGRTILSVRKAVAATAAIVEISSGTIGALLKLTGLKDTEQGKSIVEFLFWLELLSLSGELTVAIHNGLKKSGKELLTNRERLIKNLEKNGIDEATRKTILNEIDAITSTRTSDDLLNDFIELRANYFRRSSSAFSRSIRESLELNHLGKSELISLYTKHLKQFPNLAKGHNQAIFNIKFFEKGKLFDEIEEFSLSGDKVKMLDNFGNPPTFPPKTVNVLEEFEEFKKFGTGAYDLFGRSRKFDSEIKFIYNFLKTHAHKADEFIIETQNIFKTCGSCSREFVLLKQLLKQKGKKLRIIVKADERIEGFGKLKEIYPEIKKLK